MAAADPDCRKQAITRFDRNRGGEANECYGDITSNWQGYGSHTSDGQHGNHARNSEQDVQHAINVERPDRPAPSESFAPIRHILKSSDGIISHFTGSPAAASRNFI
jgi:hypothetical protein